MSIIGGILAQISGTIGGLFSMLTIVVIFAFLGLAIWGCIKAFQGQPFRLPVIGDMADKWA
jgi:uncharacterized membrane protein